MAIIKAAVVEGLGQISCREVPAPDAESGRVLVKMLMGSICGSDLHVVYDGLIRDPLPLAPGRPSSRKQTGERRSISTSQKLQVTRH